MAGDGERRQARAPTAAGWSHPALLSEAAPPSPRWASLAVHVPSPAVHRRAAETCPRRTPEVGDRAAAPTLKEPLRRGGRASADIRVVRNVPG